jgi:3-hydroxyisobutyrate dehydrogenase-like beta-hydroxyacid dehydrogenase
VAKSVSSAVMTTASRIPSVGFIGLGVMGEPMAGHLAKAGYRLALFDARPQHAARLAAQLGAAASAASVSELVRWVERQGAASPRANA